MEKRIEQASEYWQKEIFTPFLTFLSSKLAGATTGYEIPIGKEEDNHFIDKFLTENGCYYNPCSGVYPKNQHAWHKTLHQYRYREYTDAFESFTYRGHYKFSSNYISVTKQIALRNGKTSLPRIATWLYRGELLRGSINMSDVNTFLRLFSNILIYKYLLTI